MRVELLFPKEYLKTAHLEGKEWTLTISRLVIEDLRSRDGGTERKPCLYFAEIEAKHKAGKSDHNRKLVLNKTQATVIAKLHGNETDDWAGKRVTLYPTTTKFGRDTVDCIRVRERAPKAAS